MGVVREVFEGAAGVGWGEERVYGEVEGMELGGDVEGCGVGPVEEMRWGVARVRGGES